jgi:hypothetical protein
MTGATRPLGDFTASNLVGPAHLSTNSRDVQIADFTNSLEVSVDARGDVAPRPDPPRRFRAAMSRDGAGSVSARDGSAEACRPIACQRGIVGNTRLRMR